MKIIYKTLDYLIDRLGLSIVQIYLYQLLFWSWFFFVDAVDNALINRKPGVGWVAIHILFRLKRDLPAAITLAVLSKYYWDREVIAGRFEKLFWISVAFLFAGAWYYFGFKFFYALTLDNIDFFSGSPNPPW